jgi:SHS2 domain-containing protein
MGPGMGNNVTGFTFIEHTADLAVRATAMNLPDLFIQAAKGMYALLGELVAADHPVERALQLRAPDAESLLHDLLAELLWEIDSAGRLYEAFEFEQFTEQGLAVRCRGHTLDTARSERSTEIKAVTYHDLRIVRREQVYEVTVVFDI